MGLVTVNSAVIQSISRGKAAACRQIASYSGLHIPSAAFQCQERILKSCILRTPHRRVAPIDCSDVWDPLSCTEERMVRAENAFRDARVYPQRP